MFRTHVHLHACMHTRTHARIGKVGWFIFFIWHWKGGLIFIWHLKGGLIFIVFYCSLCFVILLGHIQIQYRESTLGRQNAASCLPEWQENWKTVLRSLSSENCTSIKRGMQTINLVFRMSKKSKNVLRVVKLYVCACSRRKTSMTTSCSPCPTASVWPGRPRVSSTLHDLQTTLTPPPCRRSGWWGRRLTPA